MSRKGFASTMSDSLLAGFYTCPIPLDGRMRLLDARACRAPDHQSAVGSADHSAPGDHFEPTSFERCALEEAGCLAQIRYVDATGLALRHRLIDLVK
jgi:hypothetical protein